MNRRKQIPSESAKKQNYVAKSMPQMQANERDKISYKGDFEGYGSIGG